MSLRLLIGAAAPFMLLLVCAPGIHNAVASDYTPVDHDDSYLYRLPYADGVSYPVTQSWGSPLSHTGAEHYAVDFAMPEGTPVHASRDGVVIASEEGNEIGCWTNNCEQFANFVAVRHSDGTIGEYFHLQKDGVEVEVGDEVARGQQIAHSGNTGYSNAPHLHFGVYTTTSTGERRSIDVRFETSVGIVAPPRSGARYRTSASRLSVSAR